MEELSLEAFRARASEYDEAVLNTPDIADFCASSSWILNAWEYIHNKPELLILHENGAWLVFCKHDGMLFPLEHFWLFSCPVIGPSPRQGIFMLRKVLRGDTEAALVGGIDEASELAYLIDRLIPRETPRISMFVEGTACCLLDLEDGVEGFLSRRPKKFRRNMRVASERVQAAGVAFEIVDRVAGHEALELIWSVQRRSKKWERGDDILRDDSFVGFYTGLVEDAANKGSLRLHLAIRDGEPLAYVLGVVFGDTYRGLQMAYAEDVHALGLGNVLQLKNIEAMAKEGQRRYDLGMPAEYKERWTDRQQTLWAAFLHRQDIA